MWGKLVNYAYILIICTYMCHSDKQIDLKCVKQMIWDHLL